MIIIMVVFTELSSILWVLHKHGISCTFHITNIYWPEYKTMMKAWIQKLSFVTTLWIIHSNLRIFNSYVQHYFPSPDHFMGVHRLNQYLFIHWINSIWNNRWLWTVCILFLWILVIYRAIVCYAMVVSGNRPIYSKSTGKTHGTWAQWHKQTYAAGSDIKTTS